MRKSYPKIGAQIKKHREAKGLTQKELAHQAHIGLAHIAHIETGSKMPSPAVFLRIMNALEVAADQLLCDYITQAQYVYEQEIASRLKDCSPQDADYVVSVIEQTVDRLESLDIQK